MTTKTKIILATVLLLGGAGLYLKNKVAKLTDHFYKLVNSPAGFSGLDINLQRIKVNVDVKISNPTADDFYVSGLGVAKLSKLDFFYKNVYLATATLDKKELSIPANGFVIIPAVPIEANFDNVVSNLENFLTFNINDLSINSTITTIGGYTVQIPA